MKETSTHLIGTYDPLLVTLSLVLAVFASYCALILAGQVRETTIHKKIAWIAAGGTAMGIGIWSMHFVAMLAYRMQMPVNYDIALTITSALTAILASCFALTIVSRKQLNPATLIASGIVMGIAISSMHYIGMEAMQMAARMEYRQDLILLSIAIAIAASIAALKLAFRFRDIEDAGHSKKILIAACVMGLAIAGMHYTGMAAVSFHHDPTLETVESSISGNTLALFISVFSMLLLGGLLWFSSWNKLKTFGITTKVVLLAFALVLGTASIISVVSLGSINEILKQKEMDSTTNDLRIKATKLHELFEVLRNDALFISKLPAIQGIIRTQQGNGIDTLGESTEYKWKSRLQNIFSSYMQSRPNHIQVRYIGVADRGKEIVRVHLKGGKIIHEDEAFLQEKQATNYFKKTVQLNEGQVYISDIGLNRELGKVIIPHIPVIRASTPIYKGNTIFGIIVIDINFEHSLNEFTSTTLESENTYIINSNGYFLTHPDKELRFGFDLGKRTRLHDAYPKINIERTLTHLAKENIHHSHISTGNSDLHLHKIEHDTLDPSRFIILAREMNAHAYVEESFYITQRNMLLMLLIITITTLLAFYMSGKIILPLRKITEATKRVTKGEVNIQLPVKGSDETSILADAFNNMTQQLSDTLSEKDMLTDKLQHKTRELGYQKLALDDHAIVSIADPGGKIIYVNKKFTEISQYSNEELIGQNHRIVNSSYHNKEFWKNMWRTIGHGKVWHGEVKNKCKDGSYYWVNTSIIPFPDEHGKPMQYVSVRTDITHTKHAEEELRILNHELEKRVDERTHELAQTNLILKKERDTLTAISERIASADDDKFFRLLAQHVATSLGVRYAFLTRPINLDKGILRTIAVWGNGHFMDNFEYNVEGTPCTDVLEKEMAYYPEDVADIFPDNHMLKEMGVVSYMGIPYYNVDGDFLGHLSIMDKKPMIEVHRFRSVLKVFASRAGVEFQRRDAEKALLDAYKHKSEFLATMSHELRTPLNSIIGFSKALLKGIDGPINDAQQESLSYIQNSGKHLLEMINEILDMSKLEAGKMELRLTTVNIQELIADTCANMKVLANEKGLSLKCSIKDNLQQITCDSIRIKQVLLNLISNAIKFTETGEIAITAHAIPYHDTKIPNQIRLNLNNDVLYTIISVQDTGIGIASEHIANIFDDFKQVDSQSNRKYNGTGLGLAITKRLVDIHGGHIWVESSLKNGSTFHFILPGKPEQQNTRTKKEEPYRAIS